MATKNNIMGIFNLFRKKKTPEELLRKKFRDGFNTVVNNALKGKLSNSLLDGLLLQTAIGTFYQAMKSNDTLHIMSGMYNLNSLEILEEELKYALNKWIPNYTNDVSELKSLYTNLSDRKKTIESWKLKSERPFNTEEIDAVSHAIVVPSQYGNSVEFTMKQGGRCTYIPLDKSSNITVGEIVDMKQAILLTLEKEGESDIIRVFI